MLVPWVIAVAALHAYAGATTSDNRRREIVPTRNSSRDGLHPCFLGRLIGAKLSHATRSLVYLEKTLIVGFLLQQLPHLYRDWIFFVL
jgi:hypothetical protein